MNVCERHSVQWAAEDCCDICLLKTQRDALLEAGQILREQADGIATIRNNELITTAEANAKWDAAVAEVQS